MRMSATLSLTNTPPNGRYPEVTPLAKAIRSGLISYVVLPNHSPKRPKPVMTSSATKRISLSSQILWIAGQYVSGGIITPPAPWIGSAMNAAILSMPW